MVDVKKVWIVSLEWNQPPSEVTGDTGIEGVFTSESEARKCQRLAQDEHDERQNVYEYSMIAGRHCGMCGERAVQDDGTPHVCANGDKETDVGFCDHCGAELMDSGACDNDHDAWDVDVHCTEHEIQEVARG